jgi:hypothetical protein
MLVEGDRLGGADRQCMAEAEQQPARFVEPAPFRFGYVPVFRQLGSPGVGAELLHASIDRGPRIERLSTESGRGGWPAQPPKENRSPLGPESGHYARTEAEERRQN